VSRLGFQFLSQSTCPNRKFNGIVIEKGTKFSAALNPFDANRACTLNIHFIKSNYRPRLGSVDTCNKEITKLVMYVDPMGSIQLVIPTPGDMIRRVSCGIRAGSLARRTAGSALTTTTTWWAAIAPVAE
jgi:hypothetical protein